MIKRFICWVWGHKGTVKGDVWGGKGEPIGSFALTLAGQPFIDPNYYKGPIWLKFPLCPRCGVNF